MRLYALCIQAQKSIAEGVKVQGSAVGCSATNDDEARGIGIRLATEEWPPSEGWYAHASAIAVVPDALVAKVYPGAVRV